MKNFDSILIGFGREGIPARRGVGEDRTNEGLVQEGMLERDSSIKQMQWSERPSNGEERCFERTKV